MPRFVVETLAVVVAVVAVATAMLCVQFSVELYADLLGRYAQAVTEFLVSV